MRVKVVVLAFSTEQIHYTHKNTLKEPEILVNQT